MWSEGPTRLNPSVSTSEIGQMGLDSLGKDMGGRIGGRSGGQYGTH